MERTVNLEEILDRIYDDNYRSNYKTEYSKKCILETMREACKQVLELAAENAKTYDEPYCHGDEDDSIINKRTITNTINQVV